MDAFWVFTILAILVDIVIVWRAWQLPEVEDDR